MPRALQNHLFSNFFYAKGKEEKGAKKRYHLRDHISGQKIHTVLCLGREMKKASMLSESTFDDLLADKKLFLINSAILFNHYMYTTYFS